MYHKRSANQRTMSASAVAQRPISLLAFSFIIVTSGLLCPSEAKAASEDISIKTLPPDYTRPVFESADALLSDWEGQHWASLDADQDKVALSWTTNSEEAIFQVRESLGKYKTEHYQSTCPRRDALALIKEL